MAWRLCDADEVSGMAVADFAPGCGLSPSRTILPSLEKVCEVSATQIRYQE